MATQTQLRRGTAAQNNSFTGAVGELSYDTENKSVRVHDGSTAGGIAVSTGNGDISAKTNDGAALILETSDTTVTDGSVLGKIEFAAPDEASGTDAVLVGAAIEAVAEGTFAADNNATELLFKTGASAAADVKMTLTSGGNLGIGVTPDAANGSYLQFANGYFAGQYGFGKNSYFDGSNYKAIATGGATLIQGGDNLLFYTAASVSADANQTFVERLKLDSSGNLLVGKTSANSDTAGFEANASGFTAATRSDGTVFVMDRLVSDGTILDFRKANTTVGGIGSISGSYLYIGDAGAVGMGFVSTAVRPTTDGANADNIYDLGVSSVRWDDIFATNGTIQTSDANEKQDIAALTATEMLVAKRISALFKTFRWKDKVAEKGDNARTHTGVIAQDVQAAFTAESLDAGDYSLFISSTWWEHDVEVPAVDAVEAVDATYDDDGNELTAAVEAVEAADAYTRTDTFDTLDEAPEGATERTRMGIRYPELLSFVAAYNEQRFAAIETRLTALEAS